jgi:hypothetical protein
MAQNPDSQPTKVIPPINTSVPPRHQSLVRSVMALSLTSNAGMANRQGDVDLRFVQVSTPQLALWFGLAWLG